MLIDAKPTLRITDLCLQHSGQLAALVMNEHGHQLDKWGAQRCSPFEWMTYLTEEVGELAQKISDHAYGREVTENEVLTEAIQVATLALKIAEMYLFFDESSKDPHTPREPE